MLLHTGGLLGAHVILILPHMVSSLIFFWILRRMLPNQLGLAFWGAGIFAVYPTDPTHGLWLTGSSLTVPLCFTLASFWAFMKSTETIGRKGLWYMIVSLGLYLAMMLTYEQNAIAVPGFVALWSFWAYDRGLCSLRNS